MKKIFSKDAVEVCERTLIAIAAVFALFPMWQYYSEREDRRLDRAANLILAHETCLKFTYKDVFRATPVPKSPITKEAIAERKIARWGYPVVDVPPDVAATLDPEIVAIVEQQRRVVNAQILLELNTPLDSLPRLELPEDAKLRFQANLEQMFEDRMTEVAGAYKEACDAVSKIVKN